MKNRRLRYWLNRLAIYVAIYIIIFIIFPRIMRVTEPDYEIQLGHGYRLVSTYSGCIFLTSRMDEDGDDSVGPTVDRYAIVKNYIVGHASYLRTEPESEPGYFIVDMRNHHSAKRLNKSNWLRMLRKAGINSVPSTARPSRWHCLFL